MEAATGETCSDENMTGSLAIESPLFQLNSGGGLYLLTERGLSCET